MQKTVLAALRYNLALLLGNAAFAYLSCAVVAKLALPFSWQQAFLSYDVLFWSACLTLVSQGGTVVSLYVVENWFRHFLPEAPERSATVLMILRGLDYNAALDAPPLTTMGFRLVAAVPIVISFGLVCLFAVRAHVMGPVFGVPGSSISGWSVTWYTLRQLADVATLDGFNTVAVPFGTLVDQHRSFLFSILVWIYRAFLWLIVFMAFIDLGQRLRHRSAAGGYLPPEG